jgi:hypothetical protein
MQDVLYPGGRHMKLLRRRKKQEAHGDKRKNRLAISLYFRYIESYNGEMEANPGAFPDDVPANRKINRL